VEACQQKVPLDLTPCDVMRDYTYVEDMAHNLAALLFLPEFPGEPVVNLGSGQPVQLRDFVIQVAGCLGGTDLMRFGCRPHRSGEMASVVADVSRMRELLGDIPRTPLAEGLQRMGAGLVAAS
jgi:UDP-glucuronate 4-epimerase